MQIPQNCNHPRWKWPLPKEKQKSTASAQNLIFCFACTPGEWPNWKLWNRVVNDQTENHETKWSEKEAGACWSYFANVQPRSTEKTSGHKKGVASDENSLYMVSFPLMRRVPTRSPSLSWEGSLRGLLPSHENGLYIVSFPVRRRVSCLHKSGFWSPQRVGLSQEWSLLSTEGWPLVSTEGWPLMTVVFHQRLHCIVTVQSSSNT